MRTLTAFTLLCCSMASANAADMYSGIGAHGDVVIATAPAAATAEPLAQRLAAQVRRLGAIAERWTDRARMPVITDRPVAPEPLAEAETNTTAADTERGADFRVDLGMSNGRPRVTTPRHDPRSQLTPADLDGDPAVLRDDAGRIRRVPQLSVGLRVKF
jgi:hypothetical protein